MQRKTLKLTVLTAVAGALLAASSVSAAPLSYNRGDLIIGFTAPDSTTSYLINIGQASTFRNATQPITLSLGNINLDIQTTFGVDWFTRGDLQWGVFGTNYQQVVGNDPANTLYASSVVATPYDRRGSAAQANIASAIHTFGRAFSENGTNQSTANSNVGYLQSNTAQNSFVQYLEDGVPFGAFGDALANFDQGVANAALNLFRMQSGSGPGDFVGTFSISQNGQITFTPIPEPGTVALLLVAAGALFLVVRRRKANA